MDHRHKSVTKTKSIAFKNFDLTENHVIKKHALNTQSKIYISRNIYIFEFNKLYLIGVHLTIL